MKLEIWYDFACPFCYIGEMRLQRAIDKLGLEPEIEFKSYVLEPDNDDRPTSYMDKIKEKYGDDDERALLRFQKVVEAGAGDGIKFDFPSIIDVNTMKAHKVLQFVDGTKSKLKVFKAIMKAYFEDGKNISDLELLKNILKGEGILVDGLEEYISTPLALKIIKEDMQEAEEIGLDYIPYIRKNGDSSLSGAATYNKISKFIAID